MNSCTSSQKTSGIGHSSGATRFLPRLLSAHPALFDSVLQRKEELGVQIIYTRIDRDRDERPSFTNHYFNVDTTRYFYPASTVKFPVAVLALQKLNELKIAGLDRNTTMITGAEGGSQTKVDSDPSAPGGKPTIAHYVKKILLVSDNDAFNRLYEFLGQEYINNTLHEMGYKDIRIIHRLSISLSEEQNRHTNPVKFIDSNGNSIYEQPAAKSQLVYDPGSIRPSGYLMGKGFMSGDQLVNEPFDFSIKNKMSLESLHSIVLSILFPEAVEPAKRFNLTAADLALLRRYMSMRPGESQSPVYPATEYWDNYVKMIYYGAEKTAPDTNIRIFNKTGTAYGFLTDAAYIADYKNDIEFMVSATIYCNSDSIFNDDHYDYTNVGYPFLKHLGRVLYDHELKRKRTHRPDLSDFNFDYKSEGRIVLDKF